MGRESEALPSILRLKPLEYAHITNENTNTTSLVVGPQNRVIASNEVVTHPATAFHIIPPNHYCRIRNPYKHCWNPATSAEEPVLDVYGQVQVDAGGVEVRHHCTPFPLYPEEQLDGPIAPLPVLRQEESLLIEVLTAYKMEHPSNPPSGSTTTATVREEGERYVVKGPGAYIPRVEEVILERRRMSVVPTDHGLHCCAQREYKDVDGVLRASTEDYLLLQVGSYHPLPYETVIGVVAPIFLNPRQGLHVEVKTSYIDPRPFAKGTERRAGDRFLVTSADTSAFIPHPYDVVVKEVSRVDLGPDEYCIVTASTGNKDPKRAMTEMRSVRTHTSFFLLPEEVLATPPTPVYLLSEDQAILLEAIEDFSDGDQHRHRGDRWLLKGPSRYIPVSSVVVVPDDRSGKEVREAALLCDGQGIYVRHRQTGEVRCITGPTRYMLEAYEELWQKPLPPNVERRLRGQASHAAYLQAANRGTEELRGCTAQAVSYQIPHRCVTLLYNYKSQSTRTVFGPNRVVLEPDESFTVVSLSGSPWDAENPTKCLPKEPNRIQSLSLFLGPSNMSDVVTVETRDHAQLALQLCYDWYFDIEYGNAEAAKECFTVNDFVGNACSFIASRIRAAVASMPFEEFHKRSAECLTQAVFGINPTTGEPEKELRFPTNHLVISSVDTQEMEVLDPRTRQGLLKSVKVAIEITTHAQEALAQQVASTRDQESHGLLERQRMKDQTTNEEQRRKLLEVQSRGLTIVNSGKSTAFAEAMSTAAEIEGNATVDAVRLRSEKEQLLAEVVTSMERQKKTLELAHEAALSDAAHALQRQLEEIQHSKFARMVEALGQSTIAEIARAGPELQANLLQSLGLEGFLVTDGSSPLNLYQTAEGLVATPASASASAGAPTSSPS